MGKLTTQQALALIDEKKMTIYAAAKEAGLAYTTVYNAHKRREDQKKAGMVRCPCCNRLGDPSTFKDVVVI